MEDGSPHPFTQEGSAPTFKVLSGVIERIVYQDEAAGYLVARLLPDPAPSDPQKARHGDQPARWAASGKDHLITITGSLIGIVPGEALELVGSWHRHQNHGWQFQVAHYRSVLPATVQGIRMYLGSGLIPGIGPTTAERIVARFGLETFAVLDQDPKRLCEVAGLGLNRVKQIATAWEEQKAIKAVLLCLQGVGISTSFAVKIFQQYGNAAVSVVSNEPYRLAREIEGIGFKTADAIAQALGYAHSHPERIKAGTLFALSEAINSEGHISLPRPHLMIKASGLLGVSAEEVDEAIDELLLDHEIQVEVRTLRADGCHQLAPLLASTWLAVEDFPGIERLEVPTLFGMVEDPNEASREAGRTQRAPVLLREQVISLPPFYRAEQGVARHLLRLAKVPAECGRLAELQHGTVPELFEQLANTESLPLAERQREGIRTALTHPVSVLTGGPGTGKTTSIRALMRLLMLKQKQVLLTAPTGRAAKRLSEATEHEAKTLHRLLQLRPDVKSPYDQANPLQADMIIVDEASMLDTLMMNTLLKAIATGTHVLLVGDADQLPSVGAGNVLADLITSEVVPVVRLETIFRQSAGSHIALNAQRMNQGQMPLTGKDDTEFFFFTQDEPGAARNLVIDLVAKRIPAKFGFRPEDIQVLSPMHRGRCGVGELNLQLQAALNPPDAHKAERHYGGLCFRVGDRVLQLRNNYEKEVFNGESGWITAISLEDQTLTMRLEDQRTVTYAFGELDELTLAYAISIHKAQGSEYPACVIPLAMEQYVLLERQLVYTAITRARQLVVLVGSKKALALAVSNGPKRGDQGTDARSSTADGISPFSLQSRHRRGRHTGLAIRLRQLAHKDT